MTYLTHNTPLSEYDITVAATYPGPTGCRITEKSHNSEMGADQINRKLNGTTL